MSRMAGPPVSVRSRTGTRAGHDAAQGSGVLEALAAGRLPIDACADLAGQRWFIYRTLEQASRVMAVHPVAGDFVSAPLYRLPAIQADLRFLLGPGWRERITALPATVAYCTRLRAVAFDRPAAFVAHRYTRYLGDLSGGQLLGPAITRAYGLNGDGHRFFGFEGVQGAMGMTDPFPPDVVAQIARHMNDDHVEDNLLIVRGLGGVDAATAARMSGMDADGMEFAATVRGAEVPVRIPFRERLTDRRRVRAEAVPMYQDACAALGVEPRH